jgi:hypothetical protein
MKAVEAAFQLPGAGGSGAVKIFEEVAFRLRPMGDAIGEHSRRLHGDEPIYSFERRASLPLLQLRPPWQRSLTQHGLLLQP